MSELHPTRQRYHWVRASQRAVEPGPIALSTLLSEQAQRVLGGRSGALPEAATPSAGAFV
jgi:hypothetical protein